MEVTFDTEPLYILYILYRLYIPNSCETYAPECIWSFLPLKNDESTLTFTELTMNQTSQ